MVAAAYVRDIGRSRAFYELLGFQERSAGRAATSAWSSLHNGIHQVLLTSTTPAFGIPALPLLFYFFFDDVDGVVRDLQAAGVTADHMGFPSHALGGEVKLADPDGNTVLIGQREQSATARPSQGEPNSRFSLLREAAAAVAARGGSSAQCEISDQRGAACSENADIKLADAGGHSAWACLDHADEILVTVRGAFIASHDDTGIASYLARRASSSA
jgi:catechol 2,3-dioxygenase-like lactoylglutathione lyase family enzyme